MKVYDNYRINGYVPTAFASLMHEKADAAPHIRQFSMYVSGKTKKDALDHLEQAHRWSPRAVDIRIAQGNVVNALIDAGVFEDHRVVLTALTLSVGNVIDPGTGEVIGRIKHDPNSMSRVVFVPVEP